MSSVAEGYLSSPFSSVTYCSTGAAASSCDPMGNFFFLTPSFSRSGRSQTIYTTEIPPRNMSPFMPALITMRKMMMKSYIYHDRLTTTATTTTTNQPVWPLFRYSGSQSTPAGVMLQHSSDSVISGIELPQSPSHSHTVLLSPPGLAC